MKDANLRTPSLYEEFSTKIVENVAALWDDPDAEVGGDSGVTDEEMQAEEGAMIEGTEQ